ncbi:MULTISPECIES: STAS domain-containing protein [unclassified Streptomyces]|uniref:STAS domain-containing protein n=1 Tax=unclassified Streptomyces TaxID=2593676 RepID=UPI00136E6E27|nr:MULTISPECIES: STAS domain-containing protein [unclassified Streptomyces]NDZ98231.1 STAS domain-containing protein [Streptomyces sp. SID10116]MYY86886.1 STAS domain-containing protein [Streptomyces sp. SID335]MYZ11799.1 STAS domain-containing protein [Streptomyces sp. SID337]NDZ88069.1 STAS domain-containing protein [Streptomyces sp. SID10115]NEB47589.1 STAS domain-containing protein [Streptomyces sp. SID339]
MRLPAYNDALLRIWHTTDPPGLRLAGQVDLTNQAALMGHLLTVNGAPADISIDLREVTFLNFASLHALVSFAELLDPGRRLIVHTRTPVIADMLLACGWARPELPLTLLEEVCDE